MIFVYRARKFSVEIGRVQMGNGEIVSMVNTVLIYLNVLLINSK